MKRALGDPLKGKSKALKAALEAVERLGRHAPTPPRIVPLRAALHRRATPADKATKI